jgi:dienelactone hydrolase
MQISRVLLVLLSLLCTNWARAADDEFVEDRKFLRVTLDNKTVRLEALIIKRADAKGKLPVAIIAHGKPNSQGRALDYRADMYASHLKDFAQRGYLAVLVLRRGFGSSDSGSQVRVSCKSTSLVERFESDADELDAALDQVAKRDDADVDRIIAIGVSAGGAAVTALSTRKTKGLLGVINVSGGLRFQSCPKEDALVDAFKEFGKKSKIPNLWIYARNDSLFGPELVGRMQSAFLDGGADVKLVMLEPGRTDGHRIFARPDARVQWLPHMDAFLRQLNLPTWKREDIDAAMEKLGAKDPSRSFVEGYIWGPSERALAKQKSGTYMYRAFGARTLDRAREVALKGCEKKGSSCEIVMENDRWLSPGDNARPPNEPRRDESRRYDRRRNENRSNKNDRNDRLDVDDD